MTPKTINWEALAVFAFFFVLVTVLGAKPVQCALAD